MKKGNKTKRKENRKIKNVNRGTNDNEMTKLIKIIAIIVAFLIVFVAIAYFIDKKAKSDDTKTPTATSIQYYEVLATNILKQTTKDYYVLVEYDKDNYLSFYESYLSKYVSSNEKTYYYTTKLADSFNKWAIGDANKLDITDNIMDIRFKETVLLKIKDNKIETTYVGFDAIKTHLFEINKEKES